jgi:membrane-associated protease RseP (regulator of RpoE activity)
MRALIRAFVLTSLALFSFPASATSDLGVVIFDPWPSDLPTPSEGGVPIRWAVPGSPAATGGLKPGDVIVSIDMFTVTTTDLARRWLDKTTGAAGCIPMDVLRTNLQPKGWKHAAVCIPVKSWTMPTDAQANAAAQVPLFTVSGAVEKPGSYLIGKKDPGQLLAAVVPTPLPGAVACFLPFGPAPIPDDGCLTPGDPQWKKLPKNRSYSVTVYDHPPDAAKLLGANNAAPSAVTPGETGALTKTVSASAEPRDGGR